MNKSKFCPMTWLSGFFATAAIVHAVRLVLGWSLVLNGREISMGTSGVVAAAAGALSLLTLFISLKKPCEPGSGGASPCCPH